MDKSTARGVLSDVLKGSSPGTQASAQSQGQIENPHGSDNHTDSWTGTVTSSGDVGVSKDHT